MPSRVIREGIITSEKINSLSPAAELFFRRLMSVLDDYGRYYAHPNLLRAAAYPFQLDQVTEADVKAWRDECVQKQVLVIYGPGGKYVYMPNFRQQTRGPSKFPAPDVQPATAPPTEKASPFPLAVPAQTSSARLQTPPPSPAPTSALSNNALQIRLSKAFNRPPSSLWTYAEQCLLLEVSRRPEALGESEVILNFRPYTPYFPQSIEQLLTNWAKTLDRARNHVPKGGGEKRAARDLDRADRTLENL